MAGSDGGAAEPLLPRRAATAKNRALVYTRCFSRADDELRSFRSCLRWLWLDQSSPIGAAGSWFIFIFLAFAVPAVSHFVLAYSPHRRPFGLVIQLSLSAASTVAFVLLSSLLRRIGLRRLLLLDKVLAGETDRVREGYTLQLNRSLRLLSFFVLPCFALETAYKLWWYLAGASRIPFLGNPIASDAVACAAELASWIYRTGTFFLACVLFRLICHLQILRLQEFSAVFYSAGGPEPAAAEVAAVLGQHLRIRRQLKVISHRFRGFIVACLVIVTATLLAALLLTTRSKSEVNLFTAGELALCSLSLVTGLLICLRCAAKITHQAQAITSHAAKWHVCATIECFDTDPETPMAAANQVHPLDGLDSDDDDVPDDDYDLDNTKLAHPHASTISFQKRQALVTYLENNRAGITMFGFVLDRAYLHTIFMLELTLVLWLLGKTIGIS